MAAVDIKDVAQRAIDDPDYAWEILQGSEYPEVRDALVHDLRGSDDVSGYLNPQPIPPGIASRDAWRTQIALRWGTIDFAATRGIVVGG